MLDLSSDFGARADQRLRAERIAWLVTVGADGQPQPNPVWFLWDGSTILVYTQPRAAKLRHIAHQPRVALHLDTDPDGDNVVVVTGTAAVDSAAAPADQHPQYVEKYREAMIEISGDPATMASDYSVPIRVTPSGIRGF